MRALVRRHLLPPRRGRAHPHRSRRGRHRPRASGSGTTTVAALDGQRLRAGVEVDASTTHCPTRSSSRIPWSCSATSPCSRAPAPNPAAARRMPWATPCRAPRHSRSADASNSPAPSTAATCSRSATPSTSASAAARTREGIRQLRALARAARLHRRRVPVTKALHLKSAVTALPDGTVIGHPDLVDHPEVFDRFLPVPEHEGVAVVVLDDDIRAHVGGRAGSRRASSRASATASSRSTSPSSRSSRAA